MFFLTARARFQDLLFSSSTVNYVFKRDQLVGGSARDWKKHQMKLFFTVKFNSLPLIWYSLLRCESPSAPFLDQTKQSTTSQINFRLIGLGQKAFIWSDSYSYSLNWLTLLRLIQSDRKLTAITISFREFMGPWAPKSHLDYAPIFFLFVVFWTKLKVNCWASKSP